VRVGTWNVGSLTGKLREVVDTMIRRHVNILCVQEMKWNGQKERRWKIPASNFDTQEIHQLRMM
jgi:exonuclease III